MEHCSGGNLLNYVFLRRHTEYEVARIVYKLCSAMYHLHLKNIIHRDLKLDNVLFTGDPNEKSTDIKIIDFGLSYQILEKK